MKRWQVKTAVMLIVLILGYVAVVGSERAGAASVADFYRGNKLILLVSSSPGTSVDLVARLISPALKKETGNDDHH